jgi:hypothetical protein
MWRERLTLTRDKEELGGLGYGDSYDAIQRYVKWLTAPQKNAAVRRLEEFALDTTTALW